MKRALLKHSTAPDEKADADSDIPGSAGRRKSTQTEGNSHFDKNELCWLGKFPATRSAARSDEVRKRRKNRKDAHKNIILCEPRRHCCVKVNSLHLSDCLLVFYDPCIRLFAKS